MRFPPTISEAAAAIRAGTLTSVALVEQCLARIDRYESKIHAWVVVEREYAIRAADQADDALASGEDRGPLHGIPIGVKDIIPVYGFPTRCGSSLSPFQPSCVNAVVVTNLRDSGAIVLGKTVTCEWAFFDPPPTRNPWNLERSPGGSSSGSAAAVSAGMCLASIGTQTGGSIVRPAAYCGVVGCKPTLGSVSTEGIYPLSRSLDHVGVIAKTASDARLMIRALQRDEWWAEFDEAPKLNDVAGLYVIDSPTGFIARNTAPNVDAVFQQSIAALRSAGATIGSKTVPIGFEDAIANHRTIMAHEAAATHQHWFSSNEERFGPQIRGLLSEGQRVGAGDRMRSDAKRVQFTRVAEQLTVDRSILIMPSTNTVAPDRTTTGDSGFQAIWSFVGLPSITIPCGLTVDRMPVGMQLIGQANSEKNLCRTAAWCEQVLNFSDDPPLD